MMASTATTKKIPTPIPALNIPPISSQLVNENNTMNSINILVICFFMIACLMLVTKIANLLVLITKNLIKF